MCMPGKPNESHVIPALPGEMYRERHGWLVHASKTLTRAATYLELKQGTVWSEIKVLSSLFLMLYLLEKQRLNLLTLIVTVMNLVIIDSCTMWIWPPLAVCITCIFVIKPYPLHINHSPLHLLTFSWFKSQQEKWFQCGKGDGIPDVSVCSTAKFNLRVVIIYAIRKCPWLVVFIIVVFVVPFDKSWCQVCGAWSSFLVKTIFTWKILIGQFVSNLYKRDSFILPF